MQSEEILGPCTPHPHYTLSHTSHAQDNTHTHTRRHTHTQDTHTTHTHNTHKTHNTHTHTHTHTHEKARRGKVEAGHAATNICATARRVTRQAHGMTPARRTPSYTSHARRRAPTYTHAPEGTNSRRNKKGPRAPHPNNFRVARQAHGAILTGRTLSHASNVHEHTPQPNA